MISFEKHPHVKDLIAHYADDMGAGEVLRILASGINEVADAEVLARFIWLMKDRISDDSDAEKIIDETIDRSKILSDIVVEITSLFESAGYIDVWCQIGETEAL